MNHIVQGQWEDNRTLQCLYNTFKDKASTTQDEGAYLQGNGIAPLWSDTASQGLSSASGSDCLFLCVSFSSVCHHLFTLFRTATQHVTEVHLSQPFHTAFRVFQVASPNNLMPLPHK